MREFLDANGRRWVVWEVHPSATERRRGAPDIRPLPRAERRVRDTPRARVRAGYVHGWLACESAAERRRIAPIPPAWEELSDGELSKLCDGGERSATPRRLIE